MKRIRFIPAQVKTVPDADQTPAPAAADAEATV